MKIYDAHQDIAANIQLVTNKYFFERNEINKCYINSNYQCVNQVDYPRLLEGGVKLVFATIFAMTKEQAIRQLEIYEQIIKKENKIVPILKNEDLISLSDNEIGFLFNMEGALPLKNISDLNFFYERGLRSIGIVWRENNRYIKNNKLSKDGLKLLRHIEEKRMILDMAHMGEDLFWDVIEKYNKPFIVSHTACKSICDNKRNISDSQIKAIRRRKAIVGISGVNLLVGGKKIDNIIDNIRYLVKQSSINNVCLGSDFDGMVNPKLSLIKGFEDVSCYPNLINELNNFFKKEEVKKIAYQNLHELILNLL